MDKCEHHHNHDHVVNSFIDVNGIPYLLGEYVENAYFAQVDRAMIKSEIFVDQSEAMRVVIDVNIDDIGKRASDGLPAIVGNVAKQKNLLKMIADNAERMDYQLDVLRKGIIIRVNYQLENQRTGEVLRSMTEDLRINRRNLYLDINRRNLDDNAIIANFCDTMVSTINQFTHGNERMILRITNIQMYYECLSRERKVPSIKQSLYDYPIELLPSTYGSEQDMYRYHHQMQHRHLMGYPDGCGGGYGYTNPCSCHAPSYPQFNRFYHFTDNGSDAILHMQEINDRNCKTKLIAAGVVNVNRSFVINPGHRIVFKMSIWKNDITTVSDTTSVAYALKEKLYHHDCDYGHEHDDCNCHHHNHEITPDYETMIRLYHELQHTNDRQNGVINQLIIRIDDLAEKIEALTPVIPVPPDDPSGEDQKPDVPPVVDPDEPSVEPENPTVPDEPIVTPPEDNTEGNLAGDL